MAITKSAKKAIRTAKRHKVFNVRRKRAMHDVLKDVKKLVLEKKMTEAQAMLAKAYKAIDKAKKGGIIKLNNAARKKSKLAKLLNA